MARKMRLKCTGQLATIDEDLKLTRDYIFTSPSLAAAVVMGRNANGRTEWKNEEHKTIKDIEES